MGKISLPNAEQFDEINLHLKNMASKMGAHDVFGSWREVQAVCRRGQAKRYFKEGDQFMALFDGEPVIWEAIGVEDEHIDIQSRDCLMNAQFSAPQAFYHASSPLSPGTHKFTINELQYQFTTTETVPEGGVIYASLWTDPYVPTRCRILAADRVTIIENNINITPATGTDTLTPINHHHRCRYGSNNYVESAIRQWMNSDSNNWQWTPMTDYDLPSDYGKPEGFLKRLDPDLVAVLGDVEKKVGRNTLTDGGGQDTFTDKVFLLSQVEVYGGTSSVGDTTGEEPYPFYANMASSPTTNPILGRIKLLNNSPWTWRLRSPHVPSAHYPRHVHPTGAVAIHLALNAIGLAPACRIK